MADLSDLRLGCMIPDVQKPAIEFAKIVADLAENDDSFDGPSLWEPLITAPELDYLAPFESWNELGNKRYSDCVSVTWANMRRLMTSKLSGREIYPNMDQVMELFRTQVLDGNPGRDMNVQKLLEYLVEYGGPDGIHAIAFARVEVDNFAQLKQAMAIFGALWIEIKLWQQNREQFDYQQTWEVPNPQHEDDFVGGHSVLAGAYTEEGNLRIVTWGKVAELSAEYVQKMVYSAYVVVWPEHLGSRRFTRGVDMKRLQSEFRRLTGRHLSSPSKKLNPVLVELQSNDPRKQYFQLLKIEPNGQLTDIEGPRYDTKPIRTLTPVTVASTRNAILAIDNDDLHLIRTKDTPSDYVETQRLVGPHYYELESTTTTVTAFKCRLSDFGYFCIDNGDLYFIKLPTLKSSSRNIEVHYAPHEKRFRSVTKYKTGLDLPANFDRSFDRVAVSGGDLYLLVRGKECLELHCARGYANYSENSITTYKTAVPRDDVSKFFTIGLNGDLYMIKHSKTSKGLVEVWMATPADRYSTIRKCLTSIADDDVPTNTAVNLTDRRWVV